MINDKMCLKLIKKSWEAQGLEYVNENIFVNSETMEHLCNPKALIEEKLDKEGLHFRVTKDAAVLKKNVGTLISPKNLCCNKCGKEITKQTVMAALLRGKGKKWLD
jgi:hypothetical protein